ncbi:MAG TPA: methyltransferase domain-containing protein [Kofleriaceae bacterium]|nr:methyltransferase domain-containing protein [Kofleriaceae bacterium]
MSRLRQLAKAARQVATRRLRPVDARALTRAEPLSRRFAMDRGTPIDRYYIERFLGRHAASIQGDVMEIAGAQYARTFGQGVRSIAVLHATPGNPEATLVGDLAAPETLPAASVDCLICTQTLNFIFDVTRAVDGIARLVRPGGVALVTVSGISQISRYDMERWGDYWRFTDATLRRLFADRFDATIEIHGNVAASVAFLDGIAVEDLPDRAILDRVDPDYQLTLGVVARRLP